MTSILSITNLCDTKLDGTQNGCQTSHKIVTGKVKKGKNCITPTDIKEDRVPFVRRKWTDQL